MKKILFVFLASLFFALSANAAFERVNTYNGDFTDVKNSSWYADNVKTAYELGFMNGKAVNAFDPDGKVTVAEGIVMASRLHSIYNDTAIEDKPVTADEYRYDFDDPSLFVDLTERGSRNDNGVSLNRATGEIRDGMLVVTSDGVNAHGNYDPQTNFEGLDLDTRVYNKAKVRMRVEFLEPVPGAKVNKTAQIFFETSFEVGLSGAKSVKSSFENVKDPSEWFELEFDFSKNEKYADYLRSFRFDPADNNAVFYVDYIVFYSNASSEKTKWYDKYVNYAVQNNILHKDRYKEAEMSRNITRREICELFASSLPEEHFSKINNIKGIPDIDRFEKNADVFLMLYNAGVLLGSDGEGNFMPEAEIKRSEVAAIINRTALFENRVRGEIACDWSANAGEYEYEFDDPSLVNTLTYEAESFEIKNGAIYMKAFDRGEGKTPRFDPKITFRNIKMNAKEYTKVIIRMKADFIGDIGTRNFDLYFMNTGDSSFTGPKALHQDFSEYCYKDAAGWYVMTIDLRLLLLWSGEISAFRFDPANTNGNFVIDYIRFVKDEDNKLTTHDELVNAGYTSTRLFKDEQFERGFYVNQFEQKEMSSHGRLDTYCETDEDPLWQISPWWSGYDLIDDRDPTNDKYTISDIAGMNYIRYNPEEKSVIMRQNATKYYNGKPHILEEHRWWPHLIVSQNGEVCPFDKTRNTAKADRMFVEVDLRLLDFKPTTNPEGILNITYGITFYMKTDKAPNDMIWFCLTLFRNPNFVSTDKSTWNPDSAGHQYMYHVREAMVYDGIENSFTPEKGKVVMGDEWKKVRVDITPHIERAVEWANRDNIFGVPVTVEDMYFEGESIGYEIHGNYDCTFEFKNFNMVAYNK